MLASAADKTGNPSPGRCIHYYKFCFSVLLAVLVKMCKYMLNMYTENLHAVHNANYIREVRLPQGHLLCLLFNHKCLESFNILIKMVNWK